MAIFFGNQPVSGLHFNLPTQFIFKLSNIMWNMETVFIRLQRGIFQGSMMPIVSSVWETGRCLRVNACPTVVFFVFNLFYFLLDKAGFYHIP